jgi:hypothetical protein
MRLSAVKKLRSGDQVYWKDPTPFLPKCDRFYKIRSISIKGDVIKIEDVDGSSLECYAKELQ